jgi:membrane protein implicated in regulation of membrane protease activity
MFDVFFTPDNIWFTVPGIIGSTIVLLKIGLMCLGLGDDLDGVGDVDLDFDGDVDLGDSDVAASVISIQSAAAFLMGLGWGGLFGKEVLGQGVGISIVIGLAVGALFVWALVKMLTFVYRLQSSGNLPISAAMGKEGTVYAQIPGRMSGQGRVKVTIDDRQRIYRAVTDGDEIASQTRVHVTKVNDDNTLTVASV